MAHYNHENVLSLKAASAIAAWVPVQFLQGASALTETVQRNGSLNIEAVGFTIATIASPGDPVAVVDQGEVKAIAGASLGAGADLAVGSTNGILIPLAASALATGAIGEIRYTVGKAKYNAAAGDIFTVVVKPEQLI